MIRIAAAIALAMLSQTSGAKDFCSLKNTNQLIWEDSFQKSLQAFFGDGRDSFYHPDSSIYEQARYGLGGPPELFTPLEDGLLLASACRAHSCPEKAAVVIRCPSTIESVGIIHFSCGPGRCSKEPKATLFFKQGSARAGEAKLRWWAEEHNVKQFETRSSTTLPVHAE